MQRKQKLRITQWGIAMVIFAALTAVNILIFRVLDENNNLTSRSNGERVINDLIAQLRDLDPHSFEEVRQTFESYSPSILGLGIYDEEGTAVYSWGTAPETMSLPESHSTDPGPREYFLNRDRASLIIHQYRPPRIRGIKPHRESGSEQEDVNMVAFLFRSDVLYWEVHQPEFWRLYRFYRVLFPATELLLGVFIVFILLILKRNREYRTRIEEQKRLVVLGTAAGTLAHEIKNPLSAMKLQTGIIERTVGDKAQREIFILNEEIDRLSMLTTHVNDYLRDPLGNPEVFDVVQAVKDGISRVLGSTDLNIEGTPEPMNIRFDRERFRSVLENVLLNAQESGGPADDIKIRLKKNEGTVHIEVLDRGKGIPEGALERILDPFFTTKSRGTGVGLSVVNRFLEAAGGVFSIANRDHGGVVVAIDIPEYQE